MKIVFLCNSAANQRALANRLHRVVPLTAIGVIEISVKKRNPRFIQRVASITIGFPLRRAWFEMLTHYNQLFPDFPDVPTTTHNGVNSTTVISLIERECPDLVIVSGTDLLKHPLIGAIRKTGRIMNLHTGISPYIKGGPNCTNWALALREFQLIGNTIMWLDAGIDTGNIITTERTDLSGQESISQLHIKVMDHAHDLYCRCLKRACDGLSLPSVLQKELGDGRLFLTRQWNEMQIAKAIINFYCFYRTSQSKTDQLPKLIPLDYTDDKNRC